MANKDDSTNDANREEVGGSTFAANGGLAKALEDIYRSNPLGEATTKAMRDFSGSTNPFANFNTFKPVVSDVLPRQPLYDTLTNNIDMRSPWHQLVIIGNGFDLECTLPSSFGSFIEIRQKYFSEVKQEQNVKRNSIRSLAFTKTLWDEVLGNLEKTNWCDVESAIAKWIVPANGKSLLDQTLAKLKEAVGRRAFLYDSRRLEDAIAAYLRDAYPELHESWTKERLLAITHDDLGKLEADFARYLKYAVGQTEGYRDKTRKLMCELILQERPDKKSYDIKESILSFNYTRPVERLSSDEHDTSFVNIHGRLGGEIIFGIDGTDRISDPGIMPFTKTYRLMALDLPDIGSLVHAAPATALGNYGTVLIKFYGHSLGEADYSYFQAIFDAVRLYESGTRLIFYFRPHGDTNENAARGDMMKKAIQLLTAYGRTLDNKDHGKNLIHKLLIEGRLSVKLLPDTVQCKS